MRVCIVHGLIDTGSGSGRYIADLARRLAEDANDVTICCHECDRRVQEVPGVEVVRVDRAAGHWGTWRLGHVIDWLGIRRQVRRRFSGRHFDVLLGSDLLFLQPIRTLYGAPLRFIYTPLSMIAPIEIKSYGFTGLRGIVSPWFYDRLQRWALVSCDRVVRFTDSAVKALERYYGLALAHKAVVSVYVSRQFEQQETERAPQDEFLERPHPRELLWVGRLVQTKNVGFLLRAVAKLKSTDWVLNICNDGPERGRLEELARTLGVADRTRFLGHVDDLTSVYRRASILLTASILEQYSLTLMEAYAFGVPCIGVRPDWKSIFNSNEDQIADGVTGFVVDSEEQMAERIDRLLANEPERQQMGRAAWARKRSVTFDDFYANLRTALTD